MKTMTLRWWLVYDAAPFWVLDMESTIFVPGQIPTMRPRSIVREATHARSRIAQLLAKAR